MCRDATTTRLDLLSISQKMALCQYGAPLVAIVTREGKATIGQSCCNHWDCSVCGEKRAAQEYRRVVAGAEKLKEDHSIWFLTLTCRGKELEIEDAEDLFLFWTNRLFSRLRADAKKTGQYWAYSAVTERQKRGHPHSHLLCTYAPIDSKPAPTKRDKNRYESAYFRKANVEAGLGVQCRISKCQTVEAAARYVAKYLFKDSALTKWPPHWRRVRYSHNWPEIEPQGLEFSLALHKPSDWSKIGQMAYRWRVSTVEDFQYAAARISNIGLVSNAEDYAQRM